MERDAEQPALAAVAAVSAENDRAEIEKRRRKDRCTVEDDDRSALLRDEETRVICVRNRDGKAQAGGNLTQFDAGVLGKQEVAAEEKKRDDEEPGESHEFVSMQRT